MAEEVRVRLYWENGTVETPHQPIDEAVRMIVRQAKDGTHRHVAVTDDLDADGYVVALETARRRLDFRLGQCRVTGVIRRRFRDGLSPPPTTPPDFSEDREMGGCHPGICVHAGGPAVLRASLARSLVAPTHEESTDVNAATATRAVRRSRSMPFSATRSARPSA